MSRAQSALLILCKSYVDENSAHSQGGAMPSGKKRKRHKIATHKRKKRLKADRHKKKKR
jgi:hypothetical protein